MASLLSCPLLSAPRLCCFHTAEKPSPLSNVGTDTHSFSPNVAGASRSQSSTRKCRRESARHTQGTRRSERAHASLSEQHGDGTESHQDSAEEVSRRQLAIHLFSAPAIASLLFETLQARAEESGVVVVATPQVALQEDVLNAYEFNYPLALPDDSVRFNWIETRKPERYSSAAPLSADSRQRIVAERLDYRNNLVVSVSVGPPNQAFLRGDDPSAWSAMAVARSVIADKSTARLTAEQRAQEVSIDDAQTKEVNGDTYWYYEYLAQKSPTNFSTSADVYRHSVAVSASREGYIYTLNVSTLDNLWPKMESSLRAAVDSFRLLPPTSDYVPPWKDSWRFW